MDPKYQELSDKYDALKREVEALNSTFYLNNFPSSQDFFKKVRFNTSLKVPHYDTLPSTCEAGEIAETGGILAICATADNWVVVGTQV